MVELSGGSAFTLSAFSTANKKASIQRMSEDALHERWVMPGCGLQRLYQVPVLFRSACVWQVIPGELAVIEIGIEAAGFQQFHMGALLNDAALVHH